MKKAEGWNNKTFKRNKPVKLKTELEAFQIKEIQIQTDKNSPVFWEFRGCGSPLFCFLRRDSFFFLDIFLYPFIGLNKTCALYVFLLPSAGNWWVCRSIRLSLGWREGHLAWIWEQLPFSPGRPRALQLCLASWAICYLQLSVSLPPQHTETPSKPSVTKWINKMRGQGGMEM